MSILRRIEKTLDQRLRSIFANGGTSGDAVPEAREAIELYSETLEKVAGKVQVGRKGERLFPFNRISIELHSGSDERRAVLEALFEPTQLLEDLRAALHEERIDAPSDLTVAIYYNPEALVELRVTCDALQAPREPVVPVSIKPARLLDPTGDHYDLTGDRINIGRDQEVVDQLGRLARRNDLAFPETLGAANASVSRAHAHIAPDKATGDWRIFDDGSSFGTSLFREGHRIEVPAHGTRGVLLKSNDEIYLGQVRLRFELV